MGSDIQKPSVSSADRRRDPKAQTSRSKKEPAIESSSEEKAALPFSQIARMVQRDLDSFVRDALGRNVTVVRGRIEFEQVDVIACAVDTNLNLGASGSAASSLLPSGGKTLDRDCREHFYPGIKYGEIVSIHGGENLKCRKLYFALLPPKVLFKGKKEQRKNECQDSNFNKSKDLRNTVCLILNKALQEKVKSIALPAIGTGKLNMSVETVANIMFDCVKKLPEGSLTDIRFVLQDKAGYKVGH